MGSMATLLHQMLLALKPGPQSVREKAQIQQAPSWAPSLQSPLLEGFGPAFSATTFQPTPCQLLFPEGDLIYDIVLSCHLHNLSPVSDKTLLKQFIVKPVFYKGVTRKKSQGGREGQEGEKDDLWGCPYGQTLELRQSHWPQTVYSGPLEEPKNNGKGDQQWVI